MNSRRFLLITYYWPPAGGGGVQRWLKMSRYLPDEGWIPVVYTAEPEVYPARDESLLTEVRPEIEVIKRPIWEPYHLYDKLLGRKKGSSVYSGFLQEENDTSLKRRLSLWVRANLFIPDARKFWIRPSVRYLKRHIASLDVEAIVSTGPPHSMHLIAREIARATDLPWIADFRDPWTQIDFFQHLPLMRWARRRHKSLEERVLREATCIVTVSSSWVRAFRALSGRDDIELIRNGYDPQDFLGEAPELFEHFTMMHLGSLNADRNPASLWQALAQLKRDGDIDRDARLLLIGPVDGSVKASVREHGLDDIVAYQDFMPHDKAVGLIRRAHVLILPINDTSNNQGVIPGKVYEYFAAGRPILCIGPSDSDAVRLVQDMEGCAAFDYADVTGVRTRLATWYNRYREGQTLAISGDISTYSRAHLATRYAQLLERLIPQAVR